MKPGWAEQEPGALRFRRARVVSRLLTLGLVVAVVGGCGSTAGVVKENLEALSYKPFANAFSRAMSVSKFTKASTPAEQKGYPLLPDDEEDPRVRRFVREYAYNQRSGMKSYLARASRFLPMVKATAKQHGLPQDVAYLFMLESGANPEARSPANALGMWQFMPDTARSYGLRVDSWVDERLDPAKSTKAAMLYLKDLYGMFGCWRLALSAYNSGENKMNQVLCRENAEEYQEICSSRHLKKETREFFPRFRAIAHIAKHPEKYGFSSLKERPEQTIHDVVPVEGPYALAPLARAMDVPLEELLEMNPALLRGSTPPDGPAYALRVPVGKKQPVTHALKSLSPEPSHNHLVHVVKHGDSLARICRHYGVDRGQVAHVNPDVNFRRRLAPGVKIIVPTTNSATKSVVRSNRVKRLSAL